jgi:transglutaminase-like putative cysteine protease
MQSVSPDLMRDRVIGRTRGALSGGAVWSAAIVLLLTLAVARSTATAAWVPGIDVVAVVALAGALLMAVLALVPVPWTASLAVGVTAGPIVSAIAAGPQLQAEHPKDLLGTGLLQVWWDRIMSGEASTDLGLYLFVICLLMWVTGGWLSWCVLRWRKPLLGLVPAAAAFATNLLNAPPGEQNGFTLAILVLTLALLLWTNYTTSIANATRARVKLTGDARWDFWESGLVAMAALIVVGIMLPRLSTVDRTVDVQYSVFSQWALLQERLNHQGPFGTGSGPGGTTGFSEEVSLGGSISRSPDYVFTYTLSGTYGAPRYFRGLNLIQTSGGKWKYQRVIGPKQPLPKNTVPSYIEDYQKLATAQFNIRMISPPVGYNDILFYPGLLYKVDRDAGVTESLAPFGPSGQLSTIDRLSSVPPSTSAGKYAVSVEYSLATDADLRAAPTTYPGWISAYVGLPTVGYRSSATIERIRQLAVAITANANNPYDKAKAIETYLRNPDNYTYSLTVSLPPPGVDPLEYFLFTSKKGYCEYFATAMADMLRLLEIPTRLVNGYGPGTPDNRTGVYIVRADDAHTWVESYFPGYGWITFEPTADTAGVYQPVQRGGTGSLCISDRQCPEGPTGGSVQPGTQPTPTGRPGAPQLQPKNGGGSSGITLFRAPDAGTISTVAGIVLALLLIALAVAARYLRPRTVMTVWKRTLLLARLAGADRRAGETPLELGRRLTRNFPEAMEPIRALANGFVVSAYAPPAVAETARPTVMEAWNALRPMLLRRLFKRLRPGRP